MSRCIVPSMVIQLLTAKEWEEYGIMSLSGDEYSKALRQRLQATVSCDLCVNVVFSINHSNYGVYGLLIRHWLNLAIAR